MELSKPLDLRGVPCPLSFVRAKLYLEKLNPGQQVEIWLNSGEPIEQVPNSLSLDGHIIQGISPLEHFFVLTVVKV
ncbi:MAG: sulfurtransferase TusA family protein [Pseudanabaenaceae cyanobacterium bins.68]|nr:sulfurtransferase TusA family protein [Pseudanabaenaceae cyanobacterium bins.68]